MSRCDAELCAYWDGHGCPCREFDIDPPGPGADPFSLPSGRYDRFLTTPEDLNTTPAEDAPDERYGADGSGHSMCSACGVSTEFKPCPIHQPMSAKDPYALENRVVIDRYKGGE